MMTTTRSAPLFVALALALGCGAARPAPQPRTLALGESCAPQLLDAAKVFADSGHACQRWLKAVIGRAAVSPHGGSLALWSNCTARRTGVAVTALHTLHRKLSTDELRKPTIWEPSAHDGSYATQLADPVTARARELANATWLLFTPAVPANQWGANFASIRPRYDFALKVVDGQRGEPDWEARIDDSGLRPKLPFEMPAQWPAKRTRAQRAEPRPGDTLLVVGFPEQEDGFERAFAAVVQVLDESEVPRALSALRAAGDEEGSVAYDPEAELIASGRAQHGFSGSGAFDQQGNLVGVAVRASQSNRAPNVVRIVRLRFIVAEIERALSELPPDRVRRLRQLFDGSC
jgi:hypothetical protein